MKIYLTFVFLLTTFIVAAQFSDDFEDGDFSSSPSWTGTTTNFEVNEFNQLHLNAPADTDTSYLSVYSTEMDDITWDFWVNMDFNPSSGNYTRVYLVSDEENLKEDLNGYFLMIGNTDDEISLYRQTGSSITEILDGTDDVVDLAEAKVRIKVTRDALGNWEVFRDSTGGYSFVSEGTVFDDTYTVTNYFGVFCKYTSSRSTLFYFDDIGNPYVDAIPPTFDAVSVVSSTEIDLSFSEPIDPVSGLVLTNYIVDNSIGNPTIVVIDDTDPSLLHLTFGTSFTNGITYTISVVNVQDMGGNEIEPSAFLSYFYFESVAAIVNDMIITEIFADPNPIIGLPEVEYFEIYNRSEKIFDLADWTINDNSTTATFESYILFPGDYVLICDLDEGALFSISNFLEVGGLPTLTNSGDDLVLKDDTGLEIDSVHYLQSWYHDTEKDNGGYSIERKHLNTLCNGATNWGASTDNSGGTPGLENSIWTDLDDVISPTIVDYYVISDIEVVINLSEAMDTLVPVEVSISPSVDVISGYYTNLDTFFIDITTLQPSTIYQMSFSNGTDCWGNEIDMVIEIGIPEEKINPEDIILNEVLFNPQTGGSDYIELYNVSDKIIDLHTLLIANWDNDTISNFSFIGDKQILLLPNEYVVITEDSTDVITDFSIYGIGRFIESNLPTYPNDSGTVYLFGSDSVLIDYFHYDENYHYPLLSSVDGKSLERISFGGGMNNTSNWHTASQVVDWGTPGYANSQFIDPKTEGNVSLDPQLFSPDNDGYNDVLTINFDLLDSDNIVDIRVFDNQGRLIRLIADNYFIGKTGILTWDGVNDEGTKANIGTYIVLISVKDSEGNESLYKRVTVLAGLL